MNTLSSLLDYLRDTRQKKTLSQTIAGQTTVEGALSAINSNVTTLNKTTFTPTSGSSYSGYGGCYYMTWGRLVQVHIGISGLTPNTNTLIFTLPSGVRPPSGVFIGFGNGSGSTNTARATVQDNGRVDVMSEASYALVDVFYLL